MTFPILSASLTISWSSLRPRGEVVWVNTYFQPTDVRSTLLIGLLFYFSRTQGRNHLPSHQLGFLLSLLQTHPCKHQTKVSTSNHSLVHRLDPFGTLETYISKWISGYSPQQSFWLDRTRVWPGRCSNKKNAQQTICFFSQATRQTSESPKWFVSSDTVFWGQNLSKCGRVERSEDLKLDKFRLKSWLHHLWTIWTWGKLLKVLDVYT